MSYEVRTKTEHGHVYEGGSFETLEEARLFAANAITADVDYGAWAARIKHPDGTKEYWQQRVTLSAVPYPLGAEYFEDEP